MKNRPICGRPTPDGPCSHERAKGRQRCIWHWLLSRPIEEQHRYAQHRRDQRKEAERAVVPSSEWPAGTRWCSGCQGFIPLFYCVGTRCKPHASAAAHGSRIAREYGITRGQYEELLRFQGGVCYICLRAPRTKRLAVDHDHQTGEVRGLLCANNENGCNRAVVANLEAAADGGLAAARRTVAYFEDPPFRQMSRSAENRSDATPEPSQPEPPPAPASFWS